MREPGAKKPKQKLPQMSYTPRKEKRLAAQKQYTFE